MPVRIYGGGGKTIRDATATAADIRKGKVAYVNGHQRVVGESGMVEIQNAQETEVKTASGTIAPGELIEYQSDAFPVASGISSRQLISRGGDFYTHQTRLVRLEGCVIVYYNEEILLVKDDGTKLTVDYKPYYSYAFMEKIDQNRVFLGGRGSSSELAILKVSADRSTVTVGTAIQGVLPASDKETRMFQAVDIRGEYILIYILQRTAYARLVVLHIGDGGSTTVTVKGSSDMTNRSILGFGKDDSGKLLMAEKQRAVSSNGHTEYIYKKLLEVAWTDEGKITLTEVEQMAYANCVMASYNDDNSAAGEFLNIGQSGVALGLHRTSRHTGDGNVACDFVDIKKRKVQEEIFCFDAYRKQRNKPILLCDGPYAALIFYADKNKISAIVFGISDIKREAVVLYKKENYSFFTQYSDIFGGYIEDGVVFLTYISRNSVVSETNKASINIRPFIDLNRPKVQKAADSVHGVAASGITTTSGTIVLL